MVYRRLGMCYSNYYRRCMIDHNSRLGIHNFELRLSCLVKAANPEPKIKLINRAIGRYNLCIGINIYINVIIELVTSKPKKLEEF